MGVIELELGPLIKKAIEKNQVESLLRRMALIIDRQSSALKSMEWNKESIERAAKLDEELFLELQVMMKEQ